MCVSYTLIVRYITSQLLCLLCYSGERSLGNIGLWGILLGSSTAVVKLALLDHYLVPTLGHYIFIGLDKCLRYLILVYVTD